MLRIVSGEARSGTSLMMRILREGGGFIVGQKYPGLDRLQECVKVGGISPEGLEVRRKKLLRMNPFGMWEIPGVVINGIRDVERYDGKIVKVITNGIFERVFDGSRVIGTPSKSIDRIIYCLRDPRAVLRSQGNVKSSLEEEENPFLYPKTYLFNLGGFSEWLTENPSFISKIFPVDFDDLVDGKVDVKDILDWMKVKGTHLQLERARNLINAKFRRSRNKVPFQTGETERLCVDFHNTFKALDTTESFLVKLTKLVRRTKEIMSDYQKEVTVWIGENWRTLKADWYRKGIIPLPDKDEVPENNCKYFAFSPQHYTLRLPEDVIPNGLLTRPMVFCKRDRVDFSWEHCKRCWNRGSVKVGQKLPAERVNQIERKALANVSSFCRQD